jgi:hypothetical protein
MRVELAPNPGAWIFKSSDWICEEGGARRAPRVTLAPRAARPRAARTARDVLTSSVEATFPRVACAATFFFSRVGRARA